MQTLEKSALLC